MGRCAAAGKLLNSAAVGAGYCTGLSTNNGALGMTASTQHSEQPEDSVVLVAALLEGVGLTPSVNGASIFCIAR